MAGLKLRPSKKRGMARAIELVERLKEYVDGEHVKALEAKRPILASVYHEQSMAYGSVLNLLRSEIR